MRAEKSSTSFYVRPSVLAVWWYALLTQVVKHDSGWELFAGVVRRRLV